MNKEEAKSVLQTYRPHLDDTSDPLFKEAFQLVESDSELKAWLEEEMSFDQSFAQKLQAIDPPLDLKDKIIDNMPLSEADTGFGKPVDDSKIIWWRKSLTWSVAACFIALFALSIVLFKKPTPSPGAQSQMSDLVQAVNDHARSLTSLDYVNNDVNALREFLANKNAPYPMTLPAKIEPMDSIGCLSMSWRGHQISLICFQGDKVYHLYVTKRDEFPYAENLPSPKYHKNDDHATATWTSNDQLYLLTTEGDVKDLAKLL